MRRTIRPRGALDASVTVPGSKSLTNRALLVAALARGRSRLVNALDSDDTRAMRGALAALGVRVAEADVHGVISVEGSAGRFPVPRASLDVANAGTAMRFLAAAVALGEGDYVLDGNARMRERPIGDLVAALRTLGARVDCLAAEGFPPIRVRGPGFRQKEVKLRADTSSQFVSAVLLAAPASGRALTVEIEGAVLASPSYVELTLEVVAAFGARAGRTGPRTFSVEPGPGYSAREYAIEGDHSAASYFLAAPAIAGGRVVVRGLRGDSRQGDAGFSRLLEAMGCRVTLSPDSVAVERTGPLRAIDADLRDMPDVAMTLAAVAAFAKGTTRVRGVPNLRVKESDRIRAVCAELARLGIRATEEPDGFAIEGGEPRGAEIETYDDHRIAMSFAIIGLAVPGVSIRDPGCVAKTFPDFFDRLDALSAPGAAPSAAAGP